MRVPTIGGSIQVVIVDDAAEIRERLTAALQDLPGVGIAALATSVAEAISAVRRFKPEVVILDLRLPDGNGLEVLRYIQHEQLPTRVIVLTSYAYPQYEQRAREAGVHAFLNKAHEFGRVAEVVRSLIPGGGKTPAEPVPRSARPRAAGAGRSPAETPAAAWRPAKAPGRASRNPWDIAQMAAIVDSSDDAIIGKRLDGTIKSWNASAERLFGYHASEMIGRSITRIIPPELRVQETKILRRLGRGERVEHYETVRLAKDGRRIAVSLTISPVFDAAGRVIGAAKIARDITGRVRVEDALRLERAALEVAANAIVITDREGTIEWANRAFSDLTGYALAEAVGRNPRELVKSTRHDQGFYRSLWETIVAGRVWRGEIINRTKDGREYVEEMTITPVPDASGTITHFIAIKQEITARRQAEEKLQASEERFRRFMQQFPGPAYIKNAEGRVLYANEAFAASLGLEPQALPGKTNQELFPADFAAKITADDRQVLAGGKDREFEEVFAGKTWSSRKFPIVQPGAATLLGGITLDITARKQAEDNVRVSESLLRAALESTADGILVVGTDGRVIESNRQMREMWRVPESLMESRDDQALLGWAMEQLENPQEFLAGVQTLYAQPERESFDTLQLRDGRIFERYSRPQRIAERIVGRVWSFRDVTARQQAEARTLEQAALLDNANDAIYVTTLDCTILYWNRGAERTYGWTSAEALHRKTTALISPDAAAAEALAAILLKEESWSGERRQIKKGGGMVEVFSRLTLVRDKQGLPKSVFAINTDVTEKKQLETQFLRSQRLESIGALASGIAHDLNNVLAPIIMAAPLLQETVADPTARQLLRTVEASAQRGAAIVRQVLTFARGVEGERVSLDPRHLLREVERFAAETFPKGVRVDSDLAADLWPVLGDATQLQQALMNLCINARDAMPAGGTLTLEAANVVLDRAGAEKLRGAQPGSFACLRVCDTGTGIPPEIAAKIFEPFFTTKGVGKGTGLGLSTVLGIARSHGGFIHVATQVGKGSVFELYLPAAMAVPAESKRVSTPPWPHAHGEGILVVDDEAAVREVARQAMMEFGYAVITAGGGTEALRIFGERRHEIQLVLTDMMMPEMDGPTLVAALRALEPAVRIVGISGASDQAGMPGPEMLALSAMLAKPFTIGELLAVIRKVLPVGGPDMKL